jgi:hypothetical protein
MPAIKGRLGFIDCRSYRQSPKGKAKHHGRKEMPKLH